MASFKIPVIIGVGEIKNASRKIEDAIEPLHMMVNAIKAASIDASEMRHSEIISHIGSLSVVASSTWPYNDLPGLVSSGLGVNPPHRAYSELAGSSPVQLIDDTASMIARGETEVGVIVGGESMASLRSFIKADQYPPPWTTPKTENVYYANDTDMLHGTGRAHRVGVPMQVYAMYENGLRSSRGQTPIQNHQESALLYAQFAQVASENPAAWSFGKHCHTEQEIGSITKNNRMVCFPYTKLMNAFNDVNLAGACIVTTTEYAARLGISRDKWIFSLGGGRARDSDDFWNRPNFYSSPAISRALDSCLQHSDLHPDDIALFDFYSCFPIVPKLACHHLNIPYIDAPRPITLLGGLNSFGGAGANYSMHAVAEMVRRLRKLKDRSRASHGLVLANGGVLTTENAIALSTHPRGSNTSYPVAGKVHDVCHEEPSPQVSIAEEGEAVIETFTVEFDHDNQPRLGHLVCRLRNGHRIIANHGNLATLHQLARWNEENIGKVGFVSSCTRVKNRNLFTLPVHGKL